MHPFPDRSPMPWLFSRPSLGDFLSRKQSQFQAWKAQRDASRATHRRAAQALLRQHGQYAYAYAPDPQTIAWLRKLHTDSLRPR